MIVLSLDPAASTGYCLTYVELDENGYYCSADVYEYGFIDVTTTSEFQGDHCLDLMDRIQTIIDEQNQWGGVDHITVEDFFFSKRTATGCHVNVAFRTAIHILSRQNEIPYSILNISMWKAFVG